MTGVLLVEGLRVEIATRGGVLVAVDDVTLDIPRGQVLGVVGESGAGKSMLGAAIIGLLDPNTRIAAGKVLLGGRRIDDLPAEDLRKLRGRQIGAVFQDPLTSLNPLIRVGRQLTQTITTHLAVTRAEAEERALRLLAEVGIPSPRQRLDNYPHELSGGMRQRVVLALAFACEPQLIIADEPTTALDVSTQAQVIEVLKRMCLERGAAVMLITHDMGVIANTADRILVMYAGRQVETGPARQILSCPRHPYTRGLMNSIPDLRKQQEWLPQIEGSMPRLSSLPPGCAFHPRCPDVLSQCSMRRPPLFESDLTRAACWLLEAQASTKGAR